MNGRSDTGPYFSFKCRSSDINEKQKVCQNCSSFSLFFFLFLLRLSPYYLAKFHTDFYQIARAFFHPPVLPHTLLTCLNQQSAPLEAAADATLIYPIHFGICLPLQRNIKTGDGARKDHLKSCPWCQGTLYGLANENLHAINRFVVLGCLEGFGGNLRKQRAALTLASALWLQVRPKHSPQWPKGEKNQVQLGCVGKRLGLPQPIVPLFQRHFTDMRFGWLLSKDNRTQLADVQGQLAVPCRDHSQVNRSSQLCCWRTRHLTWRSKAYVESEKSLHPVCRHPFCQ